MDFAKMVADRLKNWIKSRPKLDIEESATWFLLLFVYAHGLTTHDLGVKWSGVIPEVTAPQVSLGIVLLCAVVSAVILIEPVLPSRMRNWTKDARQSTLGQYLRRIGVWFSFILGLTSGFSLLLDKVPALSWLLVSVFCLGFVIFLLLGITLLPLRRPGRDGSSSD